MITIEQWRAAIGCYHPKLSSNIDEQSCFTYAAINGIFRFNTLFILLLICNFEISFLLVIKLLLDGDVESNPGPTYNIFKFVKASFHQANIMFGYTAGTQCACNVLFSLCWSKIKSVCFWNTTDLDYILIKGDELFKKLNLLRHLSVDDLPKTVSIDNYNAKVTFKELVDYEKLRNKTLILLDHPLYYTKALAMELCCLWVIQHWVCFGIQNIFICLILIAVMN